MSKKLSNQQKARNLWIRALRSGKYRWGKEELHPAEGKFCCLGVLCEIAIEQGVIKSYMPHYGFLPKEVRKWVGLSSCAGDFDAPISPKENNLAAVNDGSKRNPFEKIANMIEKQHPGLFLDGKEK